MWALKEDKVENYVCCEKLFSKEECEEIIKFGIKRKLSNASIEEKQTQFGYDKKTRDCKVSFFYENEMTWIFKKLSGVVDDVNDSYFKFNIFGFAEGIQFTEYKAPGAHYSSHMDKLLYSLVRKLSVVVQLSDPDTYEGGDLQIIINDDPINLSRARGSCLIFPSYILHRVTPVTQGTRHSLVAWLTGEQFK